MKKVYVTGERHEKAKATKEILEAIYSFPEIGIEIAENRNRPYNGQRHNHEGERGKTEVCGVTMRDIADCFILALYSSRPYGCEATKSVEDLPVEKMSMEAVSQNLVCWIERYMGIFPNIGR